MASHIPTPLYICDRQHKILTSEARNKGAAFSQYFFISRFSLLNNIIDSALNFWEEDGWKNCTFRLRPRHMRDAIARPCTHTPMCFKDMLYNTRPYIIKITSKRARCRKFFWSWNYKKAFKTKYCLLFHCLLHPSYRTRFLFEISQKQVAATGWICS